MKGLPLLALAVLLAGCGGSSSKSSVNSFAGTYSGSSTNSDGSTTSVTNLVISSAGIVTGNVHNNTSGTDGTVNAKIDNAGNVSGSYMFAGGSSVTATGTWSFNSAGHIVGTLTYPVGSSTGSSTYDLAKQSI